MPGMNMPGMENMPGMNMGGAPAQAGWASHWQLWASLAVLVLFILFLLARRAGLLRRVSTGVAGGLALLLIGYFLTSYLVVRYHKPGQTTLLEANTMDMSAMRPPTGAVPVAVEVVKAGRFAAGVTYTGTVVAFNDEDVYPRVPGTIVAMPVYPGDHVTPGQLLVRLDDREFAADERSAQWMQTGRVRGQLTAEREQEMAAASRQSAQADAARMAAEVRVAQRQLSGAEAMLAEAHSAVKQANHDLEAARTDQTSAEQAREAALADEQAAAAGIDMAAADVQAAGADLEYWQAEMAREKTLLDKGAVSLEEYQREQSAYVAAQSKLAQAQSSLREKRSMVSAAQARTQQAETAIKNAQAKAAAREAAVEQAQAREERATADRATAQAQVQAAQAAYQAGLAMVTEKAAGERASASRAGEAAAEVGQSASALTAARTVRGYTEIRATHPGKVIQRAVSPGVLASPGMLILRLAQVDRVRLQAYVTEQDLKWMRVGDPVEATHPRLPGGVLRARLTSIFPASDPATRTATVEALVDNPGESLAPGDAVSLKITAQPREDVITVPNSAIGYLPIAGAAPGAPQQPAVWVTAEAKTQGGKTIYTCTMHPEVKSEKPGSCPICGMTLVPQEGGAPGSKRAHQVKVTLGAGDGERTEVVEGLCAGQEVVYRGGDNLHEGVLVYVVPWSALGPMNLPPAAGASSPSAAGSQPGSAPASPSGQEGQGSMSGMKMSAPLPPPLLRGASAPREGAGGEVPRGAGSLARHLLSIAVRNGGR
jgi:multidrug efflux pump subunit AcrA (membrane-fusion protein)